MRRIVPLLLLAVLCGADLCVAADDDSPCFLQQAGPAFVAALERDLATSRQRMLDKILGDLPGSSGSCPAATRAFADFQGDLTTLFDATTSKERVLVRLRPVWTRRWSAAQCAEVTALAKSANAAPPATADGASDLLASWLQSPQAAPLLRDKEIAQRIRATLIDIRHEIDAVAQEANVALKRDLPAIIRRDKQAAMTAIDACIAEEERRLGNLPAAPAAAAPADASPTPTAPAPAAAAPAAPANLVDPPAPFVVTRERIGPAEIAKITSSTGKPVPAEDDGSLCQATFTESPTKADITQDDINAQIGDPAWQKTVLASMQTKIAVESSQTFEQDGLRGIEWAGLDRFPRGAQKVRVYVAMLQTTKGATFLHCATPDAGSPAALPQLRAIRAALRPPR